MLLPPKPYRHMKKLLLALLLSSIIGVIACKKIFNNSQDKSATDTELSIDAAKEHFKSIDKELAAVHSDLADANSTELLWSRAIQGKSYVEVPVIAKRKTLALYHYLQDSSKAQPDNNLVDLVGNFAVQRLLFFKDKNGDIKERIVTYTGQKEYIIRRKTEIYLNSIKKLQSNFSGYIEYRTIDNKVTKVLQVKDGRVINRMAPAPADAANKTAAGRVALTAGCTTICVPVYGEVCETSLEEGVPVITCRNTYMGESCVTVCDPPPDPDPDPDPPPQPHYYDCAGIENGSAFNSCCGCIGGTTGIADCSRFGDDPNTGPTASLVQVSPSATAQGLLRATDWGLTFEESAELEIGASLSGCTWTAVLISVKGNYSQITRLVPGAYEVVGTNEFNYCTQVLDLRSLGNVISCQWYMLAAVQAHEAVHLTHMLPTLNSVLTNIANSVKTLTVPSTKQSKAQAIAQLRALPAFQIVVGNTLTGWRNAFRTIAETDEAPNGPCETAEHAVVDPVVTTICNRAGTQGWPTCIYCP